MMKASNAVKHLIPFGVIALALIIITWAVILAPSALGQSKSAQVSIVKGASSSGSLNLIISQLLDIKTNTWCK